MQKTIFIVLLVFFSQASFSADIHNYESCFNKKSSKIPSKEEKDFLSSYLIYLKKGTKENGESVISKMKILADKQGGKFNTKWVSIFEGSAELCCGDPQACTESMGSTSLHALYPRIVKGWVTATAVVQMYNRLAETDGADASGLKDYMKVIHDKHSWAVNLFKKKYP